jgi:hypothetical protein
MPSGGGCGTGCNCESVKVVESRRDMRQLSAGGCMTMITVSAKRGARCGCCGSCCATHTFGFHGVGCMTCYEHGCAYSLEGILEFECAIGLLGKSMTSLLAQKNVIKFYGFY